MSENVTVDGKLAAAAALASGRPKTEAARAAGVDVRTIHRWEDDPAFRQTVTDQRSALLDQVLGQLADAAGEAVTTLRASLNAEPSQARATSARVQAARAILSLLVPLHEAIDLERRIAALEADRLAGDPQDG